MEYNGLVPTRSFVKASQMIKKAVNGNNMCAITGMPGIGKSTLRQIAIGRYEENEKYKVIHVQAGIIQTENEIGSIVSQMIRTLSPEKPRRNGVQQSSQLTSILQEVSKKHKIILSIDEAQELSKKTIYGLKKIHELGSTFQIGSLFSICLFGKPELGVHLKEYEVGYRISEHKMNPMDKTEIATLLENNEINFSDKRNNDGFLSLSNGIPLVALTMIKEIKKIAKEKKLEYDTAFSFFTSGDLNQRAKKAGISNNEISKYIYSKHKKVVDRSTVQKANAGKLNSGLAENIRKATEELINNKTQ
ncbi:MAG: ATP-binding protein [Leptospiraceae bacterium]|nr:ATP-binding protein [Leptospiraceae bacterium]